jgi:hypothetical protein
MDLFSNDLDLTGLHVRIDLVLIARRDLAGDGGNVFAPQLARALVRRRVLFFIADNLDQALAIAQIYEDERSEIAPPMDPSHQGYGLAYVGDA